MCGRCPNCPKSCEPDHVRRAREDHARAIQAGLPRAWERVSREAWLLEHGSDEAKAAILDLRADEARRKGGDPVGEGLGQGGDAQQGRPPQVAGGPGRGDDPAGQDQGGGEAGRQGRQAGQAGPDAGEVAEGVADQPPPRPGTADVYPYAGERLIEAFAGQVLKGAAKYGTVLRTFNGRDPYADYLQEQVDGILYATQLYQEARTFVDLAVRAVRLLERSWESMCYGTYGRVSQEALESDIKAYIHEAEACLEKSGLSRDAWPGPTSSS